MSENENDERGFEPPISRDHHDRGAPSNPERRPAPPANNPGPPRVPPPTLISPRDSAPNVGGLVRRLPLVGVGSTPEPAGNPDAPGRIRLHTAAPPEGRRESSGGDVQHPTPAHSPMREFSQAQNPATVSVPTPNIAGTPSASDDEASLSAAESRQPHLPSDDEVTIEILTPMAASPRSIESSITPQTSARQAAPSVPMKKAAEASGGRQNAPAKTISTEPASTRKGSVGRPAKGSEADLTSVPRLCKAQEDARERLEAVVGKMAPAIEPIAQALATIDMDENKDRRGDEGEGQGKDDNLFATVIEALKRRLATIAVDDTTRSALDTMFEYIEYKRRE